MRTGARLLRRLPSAGGTAQPCVAVQLLLLIVTFLLAISAAAQEHVSFATEDGGSVYADLYGNGDRGVVLAHGGPFNKESWAPQARILAAAGFRVLAIDFRGYGQSTGPGQADPDSAPFHLDVLAAVRYLRRTGAKTVAVVGGSMGGGAAGDASITSKPGEIDRLVLLGAAPNLPADKLQAPTLFIVARDDASADGLRLPGIRAQYERAPGPKELIVLEGSAHAQFLFQTNQAERVMREILRFLAVPAAPIAGPLTASQNPNYFQDSKGNVFILNGSQTWNTLQDWGANGSAEKLDFDAYVKFLTSHGLNFTLLWRVEMPKFCGLPIVEGSPPDITVAPHPWLRTGPGRATDGGLKFDLTKFDQSFFDRLRARAAALNNAGIYVGVYLFTGEFLNVYRCASDGYPFTAANNINGVDDGYTSGRKGKGSVTMTAANAMTAFQDAFVEKTIDTLNDLPNVLWIVSEEAPNDSTWWNQHVIAYVRAYESRQPHQHPIGYAALEGPSDEILYNSDADWVAPGARISPNRSCGKGKPRCKVNVNDSDHSYWEIWKDMPEQARNYAWENFLTGNQVLFMDPYLVYYPREKRNLCASPTNSICHEPDARWDELRNNLGYILRYSHKLNLAKVTPHGSLSSTGYCLAQTPAQGAEYLVYAPSGGSFTVDLSAMPPARMLDVEWFDPSAGITTAGDAIHAGSSSQPFTWPFKEDAVLYLVDAAGHATSIKQ